MNTEIVSVQGFALSDFSQTYQVHMDDQRAVFLKVSEHCPADYFASEAHGLSELRKAGALRIPACYAQTEKFIALEYLTTEQQNEQFETALAQGLAEQHSFIAESFGFPLPNYCGANRQRNDSRDNGYVFFSECRLLPQAKQAFDAGLLNAQLLRSVESICSRLPELIPAQAPALLHGDLWSGNVLCTTDYKAALIDPACYYGWPEADLAMMQLFGGFKPTVFRLYEEIKPLPAGFEQRRAVYNLYHLLNHLNLFGRSYLSDVQSVLIRFS